MSGGGREEAGVALELGSRVSLWQGPGVTVEGAGTRKQAAPHCCSYPVKNLTPLPGVSQRALAPQYRDQSNTIQLSGLLYSLRLAPLAFCLGFPSPRKRRW